MAIVLATRPPAKCDRRRPHGISLSAANSMPGDGDLGKYHLDGGGVDFGPHPRPLELGRRSGEDEPGRPHGMSLITAITAPAMAKACTSMAR